MNDSSNVPDERRDQHLDDHLDDHLDEMTGMLYVEGQLERSRAQQVSTHAQDCSSCRTLLRCHLAYHKETHCIGAAFMGLAPPVAYALYTSYVEPMQQRFEQAGFG